MLINAIRRPIFNQIYILYNSYMKSYCTCYNNWYHYLWYFAENKGIISDISKSKVHFYNLYYNYKISNRIIEKSYLKP